MLELLGLSIFLLGAITGTETINCSANCLPDPNNTTESCDTTSDECLYGCVEGYFGPGCSEECSANCASPPINESDVCDFQTGNCSYGCKPGYAEPTCSCPENCITDQNSTNATCDASSGTCSFGCKQGYAGPDCSVECPSACGLVEEVGDDTCNKTTGDCSFGCLPGYAGSNCSTVCPTNCSAPAENNMEICDEITMECLHGCNPGYAGPTCSYICPENCRISVNNKTQTCNVSSGECLFGCQHGYAGPNCTFVCPSNCGIPTDSFTHMCNESSGNCLFGCIQGYGGSNCSFKCPANCYRPRMNNTETCDETTGTCSLGCEPGYAGPNCSFECSANCVRPLTGNTETCDETNGTCYLGCAPGYASPNCSFECSSNCSHPLQNETDDTCDYISGECLHGCQPGLAGPECSYICPSNCMLSKENGTETCNDTTGECLLGCQSGFAGPNCSVDCPQNCATSNISGDEICNATSEECLFGCIDGFYGDKCEEKCSSFDKNCKKCRDSGVCDQCITNFYRLNGACQKCNDFCKKIHNEITCQEKDGYCIFGCVTGRFGFTCGRRCSDTCQGACDRKIGTCLNGCKFPTYCGPTCLIPCNDGCKSQSCEQSCTCSQGCLTTRWGEQCDSNCNDNCNEPSDSTMNICERSNGSCSYGCDNDNYWGSQCEKPCSSSCVGGVCEQVTGNCTGGCNNTEVYGTRCDTPCSTNCINGTCERGDGSCECMSGSYGARCDMQCHENCLNGICEQTQGKCDQCIAGKYGDYCTQDCSGACLNGTCEKQSGNCTCISGYEGPRCTKATPIRGTSNGSVLDSSWVFVAIGCGALVLLGVMATIVLVTKKRRRIAKRKRAERMSKIPDEEFLEEAQMRKKRKGEGVGARVTQLFVENPLARFMKYRSHGGGLITKIPLEELLRKVIKMDENDYSREFDEFTVGLTKPHEVSRRLDNLSLNFFHGIYPYDENRVILRHSLEDITRKSKPKRGILKSVHFTTFRQSKHNADYETLEVDNNEYTSPDGREHGALTTKPVMKQIDEKEQSNGYASVVFDIQDDTDIPKQKEDANTDYSIVEIGGANSPSSSNTADSKMTTGAGETTGADKNGETFNDYAQIGKTITADAVESGNGASSDYAHVNKDKSASPPAPEQALDDEPYAVVHKHTASATRNDTTKDKHDSKDGTVVIQKDYINASFIKGHNQNVKYIAAQTPAKLTANDFWLMVWEQKSLFVIMLTVIPEDGYSRCEKYWPDQGDDETFGDIKVTGEDVQEYANYVIRTFKMSLKNGQERDLIHMQFTAWPDEGCPVSAIEFIEFHQKYRSITKGRLTTGPTVVHCTGGIGRTGVFLALDILVEEGLDTLHVDVCKCVTTLREQRVDMVHSLDQYVFLYKVLAQTFALECQPYHKVRLQDRLAELKKFDHNSGKSKLEVLFDSMKASLELDTAEIAAIEALQERKSKDRPKSDIPNVMFRAGLPNNIYINAVIFESSRKSEAIVATQMPTPGTVQDFCQLLIHHQCSTVIMLNTIDPNDKTMGVYWPTGKTPVVAGKTIITQLDIEKQADYIIRQLRFQNPEMGDETQPVTMIQYKGWKIVKNVPSAKNLLKLLLLCQRYIKDTPDKRILVHCMDGAEQSGLLCALINLMELVDSEDDISVTSVVRKILSRRPNAIPNLDQFEMCFAATCEYIKKHENV